MTTAHLTTTALLTAILLPSAAQADTTLCITKAGTIRNGSECTKNDRTIVIPAPVTGPQGPQGKRGQPGPQGPTGPQGATGTPKPGTVIGAMLYWTGTEWAEIPPPRSPTAVLKYSNNAPTWYGQYKIGDYGPAGGIVFYIDRDGTHGLEVAPEDQGTAPWGCNGILVNGANPQSGNWVGIGAANTAAILAACGDTAPAAQLASAYTLNGYHDWYLPSSAELYMLGMQLSAINVNIKEGDYWSSTTRFASLAFATDPHYYNSRITETDTSISYSVRAIRSF